MANRLNVIKIIFLVILTCSLSSCGFKLRAYDNLPAELHTISLTSKNPYDPFSIYLKQTLKERGVQVVDKAKAGFYVLDLMDIILNHSGVNIYSSEQASVYNFTFNVTFKLDTTDGINILPPHSVIASRALTLNPHEVLEASNQVNIITKEMYREVGWKIFNILNSQEVRAKIRLHQ